MLESASCRLAAGYFGNVCQNEVPGFLKRVGPPVVESVNSGAVGNSLSGVASLFFSLTELRRAREDGDIEGVFLASLGFSQSVVISSVAGIDIAALHSYVTGNLQTVTSLQCIALPFNFVSSFLSFFTNIIGLSNAVVFRHNYLASRDSNALQDPVTCLKKSFEYLKLLKNRGGGYLERRLSPQLAEKIKGNAFEQVLGDLRKNLVDHDRLQEALLLDRDIRKENYKTIIRHALLILVAILSITFFSITLAAVGGIAPTIISILSSLISLLILTKIVDRITEATWDGYYPKIEETRPFLALELP